MNALKLLLNDPVLFWTKARKRFFSAKTFLQADQDRLLFGLIYANLCKALLDQSTLRTAYAGSSLNSIQEALSDFGFMTPIPEEAFYENHLLDVAHPSRDIREFDSSKFDVLLIGEKNEGKHQKIISALSSADCFVFDLERMVETFAKTLSSIRNTHFLSCLNLHKLATISLFLGFCPDDPIIIEAGAYQCGTTLFMAKFLNTLGKRPTIYALDTFKGIPKAQKEDLREGEFIWDEGTFTNANLAQIKTRLKKSRVKSWITLIPGLIQETLPSLIQKEPELSLLFLDTDQYAGTKAALDLILPIYKDQNLHIIIDDSTLPGVDQAISEALQSYPEFQRKTLTKNIELLFQYDFKHRFSFL